MKEELIYYIEMKNKVKTIVSDFYITESKIQDSKKQMLAVSNFNLSMLAYYPILDFKLTIAHFDEVKMLLFNIFDKNNDIDRFAIRLENLNFRIINLIGKEIIDLVTKEQIDYLTNLNIYERYPKLSLTKDLLYLNRFLDIRRRVKRIEVYKRLIKLEIEEIYKTYPCLWLVPYFNELLSDQL